MSRAGLVLLPSVRQLVYDPCMKKILRISGAAMLLVGFFASMGWAQEMPAPPPAPTEIPAAPEAAKPAPATVSVIIHSTLGDVTVALEVERAPITAKNFLHYVDTKRFDNISYYRAMKLSDDGKYGIVQGGQRNPQLRYKPIAHESPTVTGLSHVDGAISMGRNEPGTAAGDFFIVVGNLITMDGTTDGKDPGYAVFGHVTEGMDVIHAIMDLPRSEDANNPVMKGQMIKDPVKIISVRRVVPLPPPPPPAKKPAATKPSATKQSPTPQKK
jgi:peptidyl-prolyl cis-trans isomerase A (cyclophilin A)